MSHEKVFWKRAFVVLLAVILVIALTTVVRKATRYGNMDLYSDGIVMGRLYQSVHFPDDNPWGFLVKCGDYENQFMYVEGWYLADEMPEGNLYSHGCGLQGTLYCGIDALLRVFDLPVKIRLEWERIATGVLFFAALLILAWWIKQKFGWLGAILAVTGVLLCSYTNCGAFNLYWQFWSFYAPMLASIWICKRYADQKSIVGGILALILVLLLRFGFGFEFASTVLIATEVPVIYYGVFARKGEHLRWLKLFALVGAAGLLAFAMMFAVWTIQEVSYWGSLAGAIQDMTDTIGKRTGAFSYTTDNAYIETSLEISPLEMIWGYLCWKPLIAGQSVLRICACYGIIATLSGIRAILKKNVNWFVNLLKMWIVLVCAAAAPISWYVLATAHSYIHQHINFILWQIPFIPLLLAHAGKMLAEWVPHRQHVPKADREKEETV